MSYIGLVPSESTTGQQRRLGSITKTGSGHARRLLASGSSFKFVVSGRFPACGLEVLVDKFGEDGGRRWV